MALRVAKTNEISHDEWLNVRNTGIGGSDAAAACGISKWKSPIALWLEKTGQVEPEDLSDNERVYWGTVLEDIVAQEFTLRTGIKVRRCNAILRSERHPFMLANIDRDIVGMKAGLEVKTANAFANGDWENDEIPDHYYLQCQHYLAVTGYEKWYIAVLIGGQKFIWKEIVRDEEMIANIIAAETAFWNHVENGTMPAVDGSEDCGEALKKMFPSSNGNTIILPDNAQLWIEQYKAASEDEKAAKVRKEEAQNALCLELGENEAGTVATFTVSWKPKAGRKTFDSKTFEKDHKDLYEKYAKIGAASRRFSIKG